MAESNPTSSPNYDLGIENKKRGNDSSLVQTSKIKRTQWGTTPFPIPTTTMSLDEERSFHASRRSDTQSLASISPSGQVPIESKGKYTRGTSLSELYYFELCLEEGMQNVLDCVVLT